MALGVLAYPEWNPEDYARIQDFRKGHDELYYRVVEPHFAFIFPMEGIPPGAFLEEAEKQSRGFGPIAFEIRCATINKDAFLPYYHLLLVPEKGHSKVIRLHDRLYSGLFRPHLRLDIDFIPHVGIANSKDAEQVKQWVDTWNQKEFCIRGRIATLTVIEYRDGILKDLRTLPLG
ncbi:MAG: 2'-5' RNA ligase family protein [Robiginitalea sp.]|nr:2'-5' RNA ligase family protein [Robiginitalea sp.]